MLVTIGEVQSEVIVEGDGAGASEVPDAVAAGDEEQAGLASAPNGRGLAFPFVPGPGFSWVEGEEAVVQSLRGLLLTDPGERLGRPSYGAGLSRFRFWPNDVSTRAQLARAVSDAIRRDEPRVQLVAVDVLADPVEPALVRIRVRYLLASSAVPKDLVIPFYLDERMA